MHNPPLELVSESIPHIVWLADAAGVVNYVNSRGVDYTGLPREINYGLGWMQVVHPDDVERARLGWEHATRTVMPFALTYRVRRSDGEFRWHGGRALPVRDADGAVVRWLGTSDDLAQTEGPVDDGVRVERQIAELRRMLEHADPAPRPVAAAASGRPGAGNGSTSVAAQLTARDLSLVRLVGSGYTNAESASLLGVSLRTVEARRARLRQVFGLRTRADIVRFAREAALGA